MPKTLRLADIPERYGFLSFLALYDTLEEEAKSGYPYTHYYDWFGEQHLLPKDDAGLNRIVDDFNALEGC